MRKYLVYVLGCAALALGCGSVTDKDVADAATQLDAADERERAAESSGIVGVGASPQCDEVQCRAEAESLAKALGHSSVSSHKYDSGQCEGVNFLGMASGMACHCESDSGGSAFIGPKGLGCYALGRAGDCLWDDAEYEPCSADQDDCTKMCEELEARYAADAERSFDAKARYSGCDAAGYCHHVLRIEDACFADRSNESGRSYACSLSDHDILAKETEARAPKRPKCSELPPSGGACVSDEPASARECVKRPEGEWEGIPVCAPYPPCSASERCGVALACVDGMCQACTKDEQCAEGEGCVLDHCVREENIGCHKRADCQDGELCILSGLTGGTIRGNEDTRAYCQGRGGASMKP